MNIQTATSQVSELPFVEIHSAQANCIADFVKEGIDLDAPSREPVPEAFWRRFRKVGSTLWLDSGDIDAINGLWNDEFQGLTTNNSLLNTEVQRGTYDSLIPAANNLLDGVEGLDNEARVREIGFMLNLRHGLRLAEKFRCQVSIELHTDLAHDIGATLAYARRCHAVCPQYFVVKIPLTPTGLIAIKQLRAEGIEVNCTLGFSARQNYIATAFAGPSFVNVFLGRLNSYVADNGLGDGQLVGERATIASQQEVNTFSRGLPTNETQQIAASLRDSQQLSTLAGIDVLTMPPKVASQAVEEGTLADSLQSALDPELEVDLTQIADPECIRLEKLWVVAGKERDFVQKLILDPPASAKEFLQQGRNSNIFDLFPELPQRDLDAIAEQGKIPTHADWQAKIREEQIALDSLMNAAGLLTFATAQKQLDRRITETL